LWRFPGHFFSGAMVCPGNMAFSWIFSFSHRGFSWKYRGFLDFLSDVEVIHNDSTVANITNKKEIHINILFSKQNRYHDIINISRKAVFFYDD
jgi:hypothetical protein